MMKWILSLSVLLLSFAVWHQAQKAPDHGIIGGATAVCEDGMLSMSDSRRGTCSHHGGVKFWLPK